MKRWFSLLALVCGVLAVAGPARADDEELLVQLVSADGVLPEVVCLSTTASSQTPKGTFAEPQMVFGRPTTTDTGQQWVFQPSPTPPTAESFGKLLDRVGLALAAKLLAQAPPEDVVFAKRPECAPQLALRNRNVLTCQENVVVGRTTRGVAVIDIDFGNKPARGIHFFTAQGNFVTVNLLPPVGERSPARVQIVGGHFRSLERQIASSRGAPLELQPICPVREIRLPELVQPEETARVVTASYSEPGWPAEAVLANQSTLKVMLPSRDAVQRRNLRIAYQTRPASNASVPVALDPKVKADARYIAEWTEPAPPISLPLRATELQFRWHVPCEFPVQTETGKAVDICPRVRLTQSGLTSPGDPVAAPDRKSKECVYHVATENRAFDLPEEVAFSAPDLPEWRDHLFRADQTLSSYLPADDRQFLVHMPWSSLAERGGDEIRSVEVVGPTGAHLVLPPAAKAHLTLPFAACGDSLSYHLDGDREFHWGAVPIDRGSLTLPSPGKTASLASLGLSLGGGFLYSPGKGNWHPFADGELGVLVRPRRWDSTGFLKWLSLNDYELALTFLMTTEPYKPVHTADDSSDTELSSVAYTRIFMTAYMLLPVASVVYVGPGLGGGISYPFFLSRDQDRVGGVRGVLTPALRVRYNISERIALTTTGRFITPDKFYSYQSTNLFQGTPRVATEDVSWFSVELALQAWF
jgi:hypothetical protein